MPPVLISIILLLVGLSKATTTPNAAVKGIPTTVTADTTSVPHVCWQCQGPFELDCFHAEALTLEPYPLTEEMLERSIPYSTSDAQIHRAFQMAREARVLNVVVIGGSVTYGHECESPSKLYDTSCAWPHRLQEWCDKRIEEFQCKIVNAARPKINIKNFLHDDLHAVLPVESAIDLVIVDFGVNDGVLRPFRSDFHSDTENVKMAHDILIRHVRNTMNRSPAMLYMGSFITPAKVAEAPSQGTNMAEIHSEVAQQYDIPMVSFRHALWPDINDPSLANRIWGPNVHPDWQVHQLMADNVVYYLEKSYARFLEVYGPASSDWRIQDTSLLSGVFDGCNDMEHSFQMFSAEYVGTEAPQELVRSSGWSFDNDIKGDAGFIGFAGANALFDLPCAGQSSKLDIGYLQSYEGMGAVQIFVGRLDSDSNTSVVVDGLWESRASLESHEAIPIPAGNGNVTVTLEVLSEEDEKYLLPDAAKDVRTKARLRANRKFKLASMQCC